MGIFPEDRSKPKGLLDAIMNVGAGLVRDVPRAANWWVESMKKGPEAAQQDVLDTIGHAAESFATLPKRAFGASEEMRTEGTYNPEPIVEAATLPMGTGAIVGVPLKAGEAAFGAGILRPKKPPPLIGVLHGTGAPSEFERLALPPATHDLGIHATIDPVATDLYTRTKGKPGEKDFFSGKDFGDPDRAGPRTKPFLGDFQSSLKYPTDAVKWNEPGNVITGLEDHMRAGFVAPRGLLEDMYNISTPKTWQDQFIPMMKDRGYDSLLYPHMAEGGPKYNTFMGFSPDQFIPRFSPEGLKLAEERGVVNPLKRDRHVEWNDKGREKIVTSPYKLPQSILAKPKEIESLVKDPRKNTAQWWDESAPPSKLKEIDETYTTALADADAKLAIAVEQSKINQELLAPVKKKMEHGEITKEEYWKAYDQIMFPGNNSTPLHGTFKTSGPIDNPIISYKPPPKSMLYSSDQFEAMAKQLEEDLKALSKKHK